MPSDRRANGRGVRSWLYVPADRPERLARAFDRGADAVIVDLEDSVADDRKAGAREFLIKWLGQVAEPVWVRVNAETDGLADIEALASAGGLAGFWLAKGSIAQVEAAGRLLDQLASPVLVTALLEDAQAVLDAARIGRLPRVARLQLGEGDVRAELGLELSDGEPELLAIRSHVVLASAAAGLPAPSAAVSTDFTDLEAFARSTRALRRLGFYGRTCIHPAQVEVVNAEFSVTDEEVAHARGVLDALAAAGGGAARGPDGEMIDEAIARAARRVIDRQPMARQAPDAHSAERKSQTDS